MGLRRGTKCDAPCQSYGVAGTCVPLLWVCEAAPGRSLDPGWEGRKELALIQPLSAQKLRVGFSVNGH